MDILKKNTVLTIAGFDPSSGAGISRDLAVMNELGVSGVGVCTAITFQNNTQFQGLDWLTNEQIIQQIDILSKEFIFDFVKIGLIKNIEQLTLIIDVLWATNPQVKIIWDPILSASAGFSFHKDMLFENLDFVDKLFLVTPNLQEAKQLNIDVDNKQYNCNLLIKSYTSSTATISDLLIMAEKKTLITNSKVPNASIHGSGCRLSSAITCYLWQNHTLLIACSLAQKYLQKELEQTFHKV